MDSDLITWDHIGVPPCAETISCIINAKTTIADIIRKAEEYLEIKRLVSATKMTSEPSMHASAFRFMLSSNCEFGFSIFISN